jgi:hypothetical protein
MAGESAVGGTGLAFVPRACRLNVDTSACQQFSGTGMGKLQRLMRKVIQASGLPRALLARDSGLSRATLEAWLAGKREPQPDSAARLAAGLRARAAELLKLAEQLEREG